MSNKQVCMLCNAELISLIQPPTEYGYVCASCKVSILQVGKNQIDYINRLAVTVKDLARFSSGAFSGMHQIDAFGYGNNAFPVDLTKPAAVDATEAELAYRQERTCLVEDSVQQQWQKQEDVEKGQLFPSPTNSEIQLNLLNSDYGRLGIVKQDGKPLRFIPELEYKMDVDNIINLLKEGTKVALTTDQEVELKQKLQQFYDNNFPYIREIDRHLFRKPTNPEAFPLEKPKLIKLCNVTKDSDSIVPTFAVLMDDQGRTYTMPNNIIEAKIGGDIEVSDGYHTMTELYEHRNRLFIALCRALTRLYIRRQVEPSFVNECKEVWRSKTEDPEWFLLGIETVPEHQITYHLHISLWSDTEFAYTRETPPEFDGHTSNDVLERLKSLI